MYKILDINERIMYLIDFQYKGSQKKFAERIGFAAQVVFNIVSGRKSKPSYDVIYAILSTNDNLNPEWLVMGHGEMFKKEATDISTSIQKEKELESANTVELVALRKENVLKDEIIGAKDKLIEMQAKEIKRLEDQDPDKSGSRSNVVVSVKQPNKPQEIIK